MYILHHKTLYISTVLHEKLKVWQTVDLLTSLESFHYNFLLGSLNDVKFPGLESRLKNLSKSTHGHSYLLRIKSYSCFFWWSELVVRSDLVLFWIRSSALSSCVHLSTTNIEHLGSITFLEVLKAQSVRNEFTCSCSFLARRLVSGPWFVSLMLDDELLTFEISCSVVMSSSLLVIQLWRHK